MRKTLVVIATAAVLGFSVHGWGWCDWQDIQDRYAPVPAGYGSAQDRQAQAEERQAAIEQRRLEVERQAEERRAQEERLQELRERMDRQRQQGYN